MYDILVERPICTCENCGMDMFEGDEIFSVEDWRGRETEVCEDCAREWVEEYLRHNRRELRR